MLKKLFVISILLFFFGCSANSNADDLNHRNNCKVDVPNCGEQQFCVTAKGGCDASMGQCAIAPEVCLTIYDPVCGCDGKTYSNDCIAKGAKVSINHQGKCKK